MLELFFGIFVLLLTILKKKVSAQSNLPEEFTPHGLKR